ncbi:DUF6053 domain-containing protein [Lysobacter enzymogenes]|uniref:DUF6053 domain-containing protein n=1 Tax=Lysobacter enzymogenes TaxID=69 RepID=UPI003749FA98
MSNGQQGRLASQNGVTDGKAPERAPRRGKSFGSDAPDSGHGAASGSKSVGAEAPPTTSGRGIV